MPTFLNMKEVALYQNSTDVSLSYDVVVVGSGPGGGVAAAELSQAGHRVLLLDKAAYTHPSDYPLTEKKSFQLLFEGGAFLSSNDGGMQILAGTSWGGGSTVNWSASLELPEIARKEWAEKFGLEYFHTPEYQKAIDAVKYRLGMSADHISHNASNQILVDGCKKLGYHVENIPQNTAGNTHSCGWCSFGCPYGEKQSSMLTWIKDAVEAGCHMIQQASVIDVVHANGAVSGVRVRVENKYNLFVRAKRVVVSCGAINTPALLLRSKIPNPHIGKNLKLHPVTMAQGYFPDHNIMPYAGSIMTSLSNKDVDVNGDGYGSRLEVPAMHPGIY
jgi:choline dehydrogenase-like flavoprotein